MLKATVFILVVLTGFSSSVVFAQSEKDDSLYLYNRARSLENLDFYAALDTMRLYVERHPFAIYPPGEIASALSSTVGYVAQLPEKGKDKWIAEYNWLVNVQPLNTSKVYLLYVMGNMGHTLVNIDRNEAANMWYNFSLQFTDSSDVAWAEREIKSIRDYQKLIPEDTTPFHVLHFPLQPLLGIPGRHIFSSGEEIIISLSPNPATKNTTLQYILPVRAYSNISLYDNLGRNLRTIASELDEAGEHSVEIDTHDLTQGTYYVRTESNNQVITKMLIIER
jgi:hypothetical protein